jgi:hypothetical protein
MNALANLQYFGQQPTTFLAPAGHGLMHRGRAAQYLPFFYNSTAHPKPTPALYVHIPKTQVRERGGAGRVRHGGDPDPVSAAGHPGPGGHDARRR